MRLRWALLGMLVIGCSQSADAQPSPPTGRAAPHKAPAVASGMRWMWMTAMGGPYLVYYYVDATTGPSAKGAHVSDPPTSKELDAVLRAPTNTFRDPIAMGARAATRREVSALKLPARPEWLDVFEPAGSPAPEVPATTETGRPPRSRGSTFTIQFQCGPRAGGAYQMIGAGETIDVGAKLISGREKRVVITDPGVLAKHAVLSNTDALTIKPVARARVVVNGKPVKAATKLAIGDRILIGKTTLAIRNESFNPGPGLDPSCPGVKESVWIQDGCAMFGSSFRQLIGGDDMTIGTDSPERHGLKDYRPKVHVRIKVVNKGGTVEFTALDKKHLPRVKGKGVARGKLVVGDSIAVGDRTFAITKDSNRAVLESPLPSCPETRVRDARTKKN